MSASAQLQGITLGDGWTVTQKIKRSPSGTGGMFSNSYLATRESRTAFVKAFDFSDAFEPGVDTLKILEGLIASYEHERDVLEHCNGRRLSHVSLAIDHGHVDVPDMNVMEGRVYYLIFERAEGDIRCQMDEAHASDTVWCMLALRHVCLGLWQVHRELIAHQDLKPSNVLHYGGEDFRVADFGRSSMRGRTIWHDEKDFPGDKTYAPPELLYGFTHQEFIPRRFGSDIYMLGNLAVFLFTGTNITESIMAQLDPQHHWTRWASEYEEVLPYLQEAFGRAIEEMEPRLPKEVRDYILPFVQQLCNPDLSMRGHPRGIGRYGQYSLERYVTQLTNVVTRIEVRARVARQKK